jgi:hypothetical protein
MRHDGPGYRQPKALDRLDQIRQEALEHTLRTRAARERLMRAEIHRREEEAARAERERRDKRSAR